jgi:hypothetical protein
MQLVDSVVMRRVIEIGILAGIAGLLYFGHWLEKKGVIKNYSRGLGRGMLEVDSVLRPSKAYVREAKEKQRKIEDDDGGPDDPKGRKNDYPVEP